MESNRTPLPPRSLNLSFISIYSRVHPCKVYAEDTPILTIDSIVICQTHAEDLRRRLLKMHPGIYSLIYNIYIGDTSTVL
jgi:hypothetical protein